MSRTDRPAGAPEEVEAEHEGLDPRIGEVVGSYELVELIGKGGAASVFSAKRQRDGRMVALKILAAQKLSRPRVVQRFRDEVRIAGSVRHPSLVEFIEFVDQPKPQRLAYA